MLRQMLILSAFFLVCDATRLRNTEPKKDPMKPKPIEGIALQMGEGAEKKLLFPPSLQNKNRPEEIMLASPDAIEAVADELSDVYNAGMSSFLEIESHESLQDFGETYLKKMEPFRTAAAKKLANQADGMGMMFEDHMLFDINEWEAKKAFKAFTEMDKDGDGRISAQEKALYVQSE